MKAAELSIWDGPVTMEHFSEVRSVFHAAFPRSSLADHRDQLTRQAASSGFMTVAAVSSGQLVGCVYGVPLQLGTGWWSGLVPGHSDDFSWEDGRRTFAVLELCLTSDVSGTLGLDLMRSLLSQRRESRATTQSDAASRVLPWRTVGRVPGPETDVAVRVLALPL